MGCNREHASPWSALHSITRYHSYFYAVYAKNVPAITQSEPPPDSEVRPSFSTLREYTKLYIYENRSERRQARLKSYLHELAVADYVNYPKAFQCNPLYIKWPVQPSLFGLWPNNRSGNSSFYLSPVCHSGKKRPNTGIQPVQVKRFLAFNWPMVGDSFNRSENGRF